MADPSPQSRPQSPVEQDPLTSRSPYQNTQAQDSHLSIQTSHSQQSQEKKKKGILWSISDKVDASMTLFRHRSQKRPLTPIPEASTSKHSRHMRKHSIGQESTMVETQMEDLTILGPHPQHPPRQFEPSPLDEEWYQAMAQAWADGQSMREEPRVAEVPPSFPGPPRKPSRPLPLSPTPPMVLPSLKTSSDKPSGTGSRPTMIPSPSLSTLGILKGSLLTHRIEAPLDQTPRPTDSPKELLSPRTDESQRPMCSPAPSSHSSDHGPGFTSCSSSPDSTYSLPGSLQKSRPVWRLEERWQHSAGASGNMKNEPGHMSLTGLPSPIRNPTRPGSPIHITHVPTSYASGTGSPNLKTSLPSEAWQPTTGPEYRYSTTMRPEDMQQSTRPPVWIQDNMPTKPPVGGYYREVLKEVHLVLDRKVAMVSMLLWGLTWDELFDEWITAVQGMLGIN
ncbi:uncharacterized protein EV420DRAFT_1683647 [Desarmillaria tabescens]|uniref:Uncharacterized protein n=1 Tax=Armillaria tabescens TaxID=1929756 RepID=A0AA39N5F4_ARMTA|nr:uncharacterized protein EV420DRAFT_1683647 [Desarmillaria tabescens]KAK0458118.1 hypothetical protein EV420DRAFT_1683647 [Desarmillaria tabescens]